MKAIKFFAVAAVLATNSAVASELVYLSCDLPARDGISATHFDFTLDEKNGTVSYFVREANATNKEKAVFGPNAITWANQLSLGSTITRTISRTDLSFTQKTEIPGVVNRQEAGTCELVTPSERKF
ncbi:MAG: hypothetical protein WC965_06905 [Thiohalomonadaceae bacterium]